MIRKIILSLILCLFVLSGQAWGESYPIVDTGQNACFNTTRQTGCPDPGEPFNGQDAQYRGRMARYRDNGDGTVSDLVTGLMWVKARGQRVGWQQGLDGAGECRVGGHADWRAPTIKELYSLIDFNGWVQGDERSSTPFIDTDYFDFAYGNTRAGARIIDCQDWSATKYVGTTMGDNPTAFGVNFADGRIKGYGTTLRRAQDKKYMRYVRGNPDYGKNDFVDNMIGTVTDRATGLVWQKKDGGKHKWEQALEYCENLELGGRTDWRLPSAKELQSLVDYTRSPTTSGSAAIDPIFPMTDMEAYFWTSTTHLDGPRPTNAVYVAFGRAMGYFAPPRSSAAKRFLDVHGAGAQRSDPKDGDPDAYPTGHGPQGDDIRIANAVRCVTGGGVEYYKPPFVRIRAWKEGNPGAEQGRDPNMRPSQQRRQRGGQRGPGMQRKPPQEAYDACASLSQGSKCSVETPHGTLSGICRDMDGDTVCVPENGPGGRAPRQ